MRSRNNIVELLAASVDEKSKGGINAFANKTAAQVAKIAKGQAKTVNQAISRLNALRNTQGSICPDFADTLSKAIKILQTNRDAAKALEKESTVREEEISVIRVGDMARKVPGELLDALERNPSGNDMIHSQEASRYLAYMVEPRFGLGFGFTAADAKADLINKLPGEEID